MILRYEELWPEHPFRFRIACQELCGEETPRREYRRTPPGIRDTVLALLEDLPDDEWVYWCVDDKYPVRLMTEKILELRDDALASPDMDGLMFCRCRVTLNNPKLALLPGERRNRSGDVYLERRSWYQFWVHQFLRVKVIRYLYRSLPDLPGAKPMNPFENNVEKLPEHRLYVTRENFAVFGESTSRGAITQNCYESIRETGIELPERFQKPDGRHILLGKL